MFHENDGQELDSLFSYLNNNNYITLSMEETLDIVEGRRRYTGKEVVLTFDDGKLALWTIAGPKLKEYGLKAIAFVNPGKVSEQTTLRKQHASQLNSKDIHSYCNWEELSQLHKMDVDIQSHGQHHKKSLFHNAATHGNNAEKLLQSLTDSRQALIKKIIGKQLLFCAPYGSISTTLINCSKKAGYKHLVGISPHEGIDTFYGIENDFENRDYILRMNYRSILSLPGKNRETVFGRLLRRLNSGGDRDYRK